MPLADPTDGIQAEFPAASTDNRKQLLRGMLRDRIVHGIDTTLYENGGHVRANSWLFKLLEFYGTRVRHRGQWRVHALLRRWLNPNVDVDLEVVRDGHRWLLNPSDYVQSEFFWLSSRDAWEIFHLKKLLKPGYVIFDVGANFGHYAITLADALQRDCKVYAFEPFPPNLERLRTNVRLNALENTIQVHAIGLADSVGSGHMTTRADNSGAATLAGGANGGFRVELTTLDSFCAQHRIEKLDFIKIDIEGYEEKLFLGGVRTIRRFAPLILIELDPPKLMRAGSSVDRVVAQLNDFEYELRVAQRDHLVPLGVLPRGQDYINVFCLQRTHEALLS